jgi:hypothetical protein
VEGVVYVPLVAKQAKAALLPPVCNKLIYGGFVAPPPLIFHLQSFSFVDLLLLSLHRWATSAGS